MKRLKHYDKQMCPTEQAAFLEILLFVAGALALVSTGTLLSKWLRPHCPRAGARSTYESGEAPLERAWGSFNARFYVLAIVFVLFEVETLLLFPWATVWSNPMLNYLTGGLWVYYTLASVGTFVGLLAIGLGYVWRKGYFVSTPPPPVPSFTSPVPSMYYEQVNLRYAKKHAEVTKTT